MINSLGNAGPLDVLSKFISGIGNKADKYDVRKDYLMNGFKGIEMNEKQDSKFKKEMMEKVQDYTIINPKNNEYNSSKVFLSKKMLLSYLMGTYKEFFKTENFQRQYSYELPNILWRFERRKHLGDYVLLFPNPDFRNDYDKPAKDPKTIPKNWISSSKAHRIMEHLLDIQLDFPQRRKFIDSLKAAFEEAFKNLEDYNSESLIQNQKNNNLAKNIKKKKNADWIKKRNEENKKLREEERKKNNQGKPMNIGEKKDEKKEEEIEDKIINNKPTSKEKKDGEKDEVHKTENQEEENEEDEEEQREKDKRIRKILFGGGFYERRKVETDGKSVITWVRSTEKTKDFATLLRQTIYSLIASQGLVTREFVSDDGAYIVLVIHCPEQNLKKIAQKMQLSKQLDLTLTDIMSLEPIDNRYRPFRTNEVLWNEIKWFKKYGNKKGSKEKGGLSNSDIKNLRENIKNLISDSIRFKKIVRDLHGIWDRNDDLNNIEGTVYEHDDISLESWKNYYLYLQILNHKIQIIRKFHKEVLKEVIKSTDEKEIVVNNNKLKKRLDRYRITKILSVLYRSAMLDSLNEINDFIKNQEIQKAKQLKRKPVKIQNMYLRNIWNAIKVNPFEANMDFLLATNKNRPRIRQFLKVIWKEYYYANGESTHFTEIERLKCVNWLTNKILDMNHVSKVHEEIYDKIPQFSKYKGQIADNFFPLHNPERLSGKNLDKIFGDLFESKGFFEFEMPHEIKVRAKFKQKVDTGNNATIKKKKTGDNNNQSPFKFNPQNKNAPPPKILKPNPEEVGNDQIKENKLSKAGANSKLLSGKIRKNAMKVMMANKAFKLPHRINDLVESKDKINKMFKNKNTKLNDPLSYYEKIIYNMIKGEKATHHLNLITMYNEEGEGNGNKESDFKSSTKKMLKNHLPVIEWPLNQAYKINIFKPWIMSTRTLRAYFGEKITLFIHFFSFYLSSVLPMAIIGIPIFVIQFLEHYLNDQKLVEDLQLLTNYIISYLIIIWSGVIVLKWERKERFFALRFGQIDSIEEEKVRKNFKGVYVRSIVDDFMNDKSQSYKSLVVRMIVNYIIAITFLGISTALSLLILYLKHNSYNNETLPRWDYFELNQLLWNTIDCIKGFLIDGIYIVCLKRLIVWENHKFIKDHEKSLVNLSFFFILLNTSIPYAMILFLPELQLSSDCIGTCFEEGSIYFTTFVVYLFGVNMLLFSLYFAKKVPIPGLLDRKHKEEDNGKEAKTEMDVADLDKEKMHNEEEMKKLTKTVLQNEDMIYKKLNKEVMRQVNLNVYNSDEDFDGLILLYIEIVLNFALVSIVGVAFPLAFVISYAGLVIKYISLKNQMITSNRRPDPEDCGNIGHFKEVMRLVNSIAIFANSLTLSAGEKNVETRERILTFLFNLFFMIAINFILPFMVSEESEKVKILKKRQQFVTNKISQSLNKTANTVSKTIKIQPNFFIYGKPELHKKKNYEGTDNKKNK